MEIGLNPRELTQLLYFLELRIHIAISVYWEFLDLAAELPVEPPADDGPSVRRPWTSSVDFDAEGRLRGERTLIP